MKCKCTTSLKIVLGIVGISHLIIGILGCFPIISISKLASVFYKANVIATSHLEHVAQMFGAYMLTIGLLALIALKDPLKNGSIIIGLGFLLTVRVIQRIIFSGEVNSVFGIPTGWYWTQTIFFLILAVSLFVLRP